jgi:hypothetical protein
MRKTTIEVKARLIVPADDGVDMGEVMSEMDYNFKSQTDGADIEDMEIVDFDVVDSK